LALNFPDSYRGKLKLHLQMKVLVTGGSAGIGLEISKRFAKNGYDICWIALFEEEVQEAKKELLSEFPNTSINYLIQDLSKEEGAKKTYDWIKTQNFEIDVLINNAGFGTFGLSHEISIEKEVNMINLNVLTVFKLTRMFLNEMIQKDKGTIINISSSSSLQPVPRMAAYAATKSFVAHYSQALSQELKEQKSKVKVITICPAGTKNTKFKVAANMENIKTFEGLQATTKEEVADDVWKTFSKGKSYYLTGTRLRRTRWLSKVLPKSFVYRMIKDELSEK